MDHDRKDLPTNHHRIPGITGSSSTAFSEPPGTWVCAEGGDLTLRVGNTSSSTKPWPHIAPRTQKHVLREGCGLTGSQLEESRLLAEASMRHLRREACTQKALRGRTSRVPTRQSRRHWRLCQEHNVTDTRDVGISNSMKQTHHRVEPVYGDQETAEAK